ncbi:MAG TPA: sodium/glutamate symporter [Candidatus Angelobacter sp.]|nr:sodium/glutamate symporter [Candidatus Angelobacter sp.]
MTAGIPTWNLNAVQVLALGCLGVLMGRWLKKRLPALDRLCIPTSIVGGMIFALAALLFRDRLVNFEMDSTLRDLMMIAFMSTIGLNARWNLLRRGGTQVLWMLVLASCGAVLQNLLGMGLAKLLHINPLMGILSGSVALAGGPATAVAFGSTFEAMGVRGATELGLASATFGIAVSGLVGGYIGSQLIRRYRLQPQQNSIELTEKQAAQSDGLQSDGRASGREQKFDAASLLSTILTIGLAMGIGSLISLSLTKLGFILPSYIGAMIAAAALRNFNDRFPFLTISESALHSCAQVSLYLFIVMAVLALKLWELAHLAIPLIVILIAQVALCWLMCVVASFRTMGRDYESAVMAAGFCGFMLGITANAVACMEELVEKYGPAQRAFLVVPVVGAFLIDFTNALIITTMANLIR